MGNNTPEEIIENWELHIMEMIDNGAQRQLGIIDKQWDMTDQGNGGKWSITFHLETRQCGMTT